MKNLILTLLFINISFASDNIVSEIKEATYQFQFNGDQNSSAYSGMSVAVLYNNQKFILTNRHVCFGSNLENFSASFICVLIN